MSQLQTFYYSTPKRTLQYGSPLDQKLNELYNSIKDHADPRGRMLSTPFIKLPLKQVSRQKSSTCIVLWPLCDFVVQVSVHVNFVFEYELH